MIAFWCGVALMIGIVLLIVWLPALRSGKTATTDIRKETNIALYRTSLHWLINSLVLMEKTRFCLMS